MEYKYYLVDDAIVKVPSDKDMTGYPEVPIELVEGYKPCEVLVELYKRAKGSKENAGKD